MQGLGVASKLNADWEFLLHMHDIGRARAEAWLAGDFDERRRAFDRRYSREVPLRRPCALAAKPRTASARRRRAASLHDPAGLHPADDLGDHCGDGDRASAEDRTAQRARGVDRRERRPVRAAASFHLVAHGDEGQPRSRRDARTPDHRTRSGARGGAGCWRCRACRRWSAKRRRCPADR